MVSEGTEMPRLSRSTLIVLFAIGVVVICDSTLRGQSAPPAREYRLDENWPQLPVELQAKLKSCQEAECEGRINSIIEAEDGSFWMLTRFDPPFIHVSAAGKLLSTFGDGMFVQTYGLCIDRDGNLWAGDSGVGSASAS